MRTSPRHHSRAQRGLTLIELIVGVFIATFLTAAAVAFAAHESRLMGFSRENLDMAQSSRASLDMLLSDIGMAGGGLGFDGTGTFRGLDIGRFGYGACNFNGTGGEIGFDPPVPVGLGAHTLLNLRTVGPQGTRPVAYQMPTMDLLTIYADGNYASIASQSPGRGQFCAPLAPAGFGGGPVGGNVFGNRELALLATEDSLVSYAVTIQTNNTPGACVDLHQCVNGCINFTYNAAPNYLSEPAAPNANYLGGEIRGGLKNVVWFVADNPQGDGTLRRHVFDIPNLNCAARDNALGGAVADNVETMQFQLYQYIDDPAIAPVPRWVNMGQSQLNGQRFKTRMDVEIVMRSRSSSDAPKRPAPLRLQSNLCVPNVGACNTPQDVGQRDVYRASVEVRNAGL